MHIYTDVPKMLIIGGSALRDSPPCPPLWFVYEY